MNNTIGIDISKDTLDAHRLADGQHKQFLNGKTGHAQLVKWIGKQSDPLIIFEATGAYHRQLERVLCTHIIPFVKVNPKQARRFAQASGKLAKTDRVDCEMLAKMGAALQLMPKPFTAENLYDLKELLFVIQSAYFRHIHEDHECCNRSNAGNAEQNIQPFAHVLIFARHVQHQRINFCNIVFDLT